MDDDDDDFLDDVLVDVLDAVLVDVVVDKHHFIRFWVLINIINQLGS